jgi:hypothetical protein
MLLITQIEFLINLQKMAYNATHKTKYDFSKFFQSYWRYT